MANIIRITEVLPLQNLAQIAQDAALISCIQNHDSRNCISGNHEANNKSATKALRVLVIKKTAAKATKSK